MRTIIAILLLVVVTVAQAANPYYTPATPFTNKGPVIGMGGGRVGPTNAPAFKEDNFLRPAGLENANYGVPQVIVYTGGAGDWEDAASMQMWILLHKSGKINLRGVALGTGGWRVLGTNDASIEAMSTLFDYYQVNPGQVPLSLYTNSTWGFLPIDGPGSGYTTNGVYPTNTLKLFTWYMTNKAPGKYVAKGAPYDSTLNMFRRVLSDADTNSITFCINHPIQPLTELFNSPADQFSPLTGEALFNSRVRQVTIMAGDYTNCTVVNGEYNISTSTGTAYSNIVARILKPITWIGFGLGRAIPSSAEPTHVKSMSQGWQLLSRANPMYDLAYQTTTTGNTGRAAWGGVNALISAYMLASYSTETNIYLTLYTNAYITSNSIPSSVSNDTVRLMSFYNLGTNKILPSGSNYWVFDGVNHNQRYLNYVNTNYVQWLLDQYNYTTQFDPVQNLFNNSSTTPLGIGTASPVDRVQIQMTNSVVIFRSDNNYAKIRFGQSATVYGEIASQGVDMLFSAGNAGTGVFEWYQGPFTDSTSLTMRIGSRRGLYVGPSNGGTLLDYPGAGAGLFSSNVWALNFIATDHVATASSSLSKTGLTVYGKFSGASPLFKVGASNSLARIDTYYGGLFIGGAVGDDTYHIKAQNGVTQIGAATEIKLGVHHSVVGIIPYTNLVTLSESNIWASQMTVTNGVGSTSNTATNAVAATGITNTSLINRQVLVIPTATAYQIKNAAGVVVANVPSSSTPLVWTLQANGGAVTAASGLAGTLLDW